jgi:LCP family protein required for cell wall assembly
MAVWPITNCFEHKFHRPVSNYKTHTFDIIQTMLRILGYIVLILSLLAACNMPESLQPISQASPATQTPLAVSQLILATQDPNATATATPFQPVAPTLTSTITPSPTPRPTATLRPPKPAEINPGYSGGDLTPPEGQVRIMVLGSDKRSDGSFRTDVLMLVAINPNGSASVVSFPRDLWIFIPGYGEQRINTAFEFVGFEGLANALEYNFGVRPDHYVMTNFQGFVDIVDSLDGIDIYAAKELTDLCALPGQDFGYCTIEPGVNHLDGYKALWYVRSRYSSSDFDRTRRAQEVLQGLFFRLMNLNVLTHVKNLYKSYSDNVETDLGLGDILSLLPLAPKLVKSNNIRRYAIGPGQVSDYIIPGSGAWVEIPNLNACRDIIRQALAP